MDPLQPGLNPSPEIAIIYVVDADLAVCDAISVLLSGLGVAIKAFHSADDVLRQPLNDDVACLLIDEDLPDINGVELLERLNVLGVKAPTIIMASCSDVPTAVRAMRAKAVDFIEKPFVEGMLLKRIKNILELNRKPRPT